MKSLIAALAFFAWHSSSLASATEIDVTDTGTFEILNEKFQPMNWFYRLSLGKQGKWIMEGRRPGEKWIDISCDSKCEYQKATDEDLHHYFSKDWLEDANIACIKNIAQAFCRFVSKKDPQKPSYV